MFGHVSALASIPNDLPPKVADFAFILGELAVLQVLYSLLGRVLGFGELM
jgi:hypothetical protein